MNAIDLLKRINESGTPNKSKENGVTIKSVGDKIVMSFEYDVDKGTKVLERLRSSLWSKDIKAITQTGVGDVNIHLNSNVGNDDKTRMMSVISSNLRSQGFLVR